MKKYFVFLVMLLSFSANAAWFSFYAPSDIGGTLELKIHNSGTTDVQTVLISGQGFYSAQEVSYPYNSYYKIIIASQPEGKTCSLTRRDTGESVNEGVIDKSTMQFTVTCGDAQMLYLPIQVKGLNGELTLKSNLGGRVTFYKDEIKSFSHRFSIGSTFEIIKVSEPESQTCEITPENGTIHEKSVVSVICKTKSISQFLQVEVQGLNGQLSVSNGTDTLQFDKDEMQKFDAFFTDGEEYALTIKQSPYHQICEFTFGQEGTVSDQVEAKIVCRGRDATTYTVSVRLEISAPDAVMVSNQDGEQITLTTFGEVKSFAQKVEAGKELTLKLDKIPTGQRCTFENTDSTIFSSPIDNDLTVTLKCVRSSQTSMLNFNVTGLEGEMTVAYDNEVYPVVEDGNYHFPTAYPSGQSFEITVTSPIEQVCEVTKHTQIIGDDMEATIVCRDISTTARAFTIDAPAKVTVGEVVTFKVTSVGFDNDCVTAVLFKENAMDDDGAMHKSPDCVKTFTVTHVYNEAGQFESAFAYLDLKGYVQGTHVITVEEGQSSTLPYVFYDGFD